MKSGYRRFKFYTAQLADLLAAAREQENPALWLYRNNARTTFFMLEALARLYEKMHDEKLFGKLKERFKIAEDLLGQIDYFQWLLDSIKNRQLPNDILKQINGQLNDSAANFNQFLSDEGWLSDDNRRIKKIRKKLKEADWKKDSREIEEISDVYRSAIENIIRFTAGTGMHFDNVEEDVHELRRRLRWLSIYPQALQGSIVYAPESRPEPEIEKYLTQEIVTSPFNKLPEADRLPVLQIDKNYFLALSWIISELGKLKDEGLLVMGLADALHQSSGNRYEDELMEAERLTGKEQGTLIRILRTSEDITKTFFRERNLEHLIVGVKYK